MVRRVAMVVMGSPVEKCGEKNNRKDKNLLVPLSRANHLSHILLYVKKISRCV